MDYEALKEKIYDAIRQDTSDYDIIDDEEFAESLTNTIIGIIRTQEKNMPVIDEENIDDFFPSAGETKYGFLR